LDIRVKAQIETKIIDYLKRRIPSFRKEGKMFDCPFKDSHLEKKDNPTANIYPKGSNKVHCFDPNCGGLGNIFSLCRKLEFKGEKNVSDDDIGKYLIKIMDIKIDEKVENLFDWYESMGWSLTPVEKNGKRPDIEKEWQNKIHKNKVEWMDWYDAGINFGLNCGKISNCIAFDVDAMPKDYKKKIYDGKASKDDIEEAKRLRKENLQKVYDFIGISNNDVLTQDTFGGVHLIFEYDEEIPKCVIKIEDVGIEVQSTGSVIVIDPSMVNGFSRKFNNKSIIKIPQKLKDYVLSFKSKLKEDDSIKKEILELGIENEISFENLNGNRNNTLLHLFASMSKFQPLDIAKKNMILFNKLLDKKLPSNELYAMHNQIKKYRGEDKNFLSDEVVKYLEDHEEASARDLKECLGVEIKDIRSVLAELIKEHKVYKQRSLYKAVKKANWKTAFIEECKILPYRIPYFDNFATFRQGDMICIGGSSGTGKSFIALNMIKKIVDQPIQPEGGIRYLSSEPGNRHANIAMKLGLREGDYFFDESFDPHELELEDNAFTIIDWLLPDDFAQTANIYKRFAKQLNRHKGICVIFSQLNENDGFYGKKMVEFFASLACKYFFNTTNGVTDNLNTHFKTTKIRESKVYKQIIDIPTYYDLNTGVLEIKK